jgi:hypothetical protein
MKKKELFYLSGEETTVVEKFADLNKAFTEAQIYRINKEAVYRERLKSQLDSLQQRIKSETRDIGGKALGEELLKGKIPLPIF